MCTVTVNVDEVALKSVNSGLTSTAAISQWIQQMVDQCVEEMTLRTDDEDRDMSVEELYHAIEQDVKAIYAE